MGQNFNPDNYATIKRVTENLESGAFSRLKPAFENVKEQAEQSGVPALITSCNGASEGIDALLASFKSLMEVLNQYLADNKVLYEALGYDV